MPPSIHPPCPSPKAHREAPERAGRKALAWGFPFTSVGGRSGSWLRWPGKGSEPPGPRWRRWGCRGRSIRRGLRRIHNLVHTAARPEGSSRTAGRRLLGRCRRRRRRRAGSRACTGRWPGRTLRAHCKGPHRHKRRECLRRRGFHPCHRPPGRCRGSGRRNIRRPDIQAQRIGRYRHHNRIQCWDWATDGPGTGAVRGRIGRWRNRNVRCRCKRSRHRNPGPAHTVHIGQYSHHKVPGSGMDRNHPGSRVVNHKPRSRCRRCRRSIAHRWACADRFPMDRTYQQCTLSGHHNRLDRCSDKRSARNRIAQE